MKNIISESEKNRILNLHKKHFILNEQSPFKVEPFIIPSDTTGTNIGSDSIRVKSNEMGVNNKYKVKIKGISGLKILSFSLNPDGIKMKIEIPYGKGVFVKNILRGQKDELKNVGVTYNYIGGGITSKDKVDFTINATKSKGRVIIIRVLKGNKDIEVIGQNVKLVKV